MPQLALLGGDPVRPQGPPNWPIPDAGVFEALQAAYRDGSWGKYYSGHVERLEVTLAAYHNVAFALTCGSGTFAVELALRALKVGPGDEVILSAYDFPGNFLAIHAIAALPVLIDVASGNWNLDPRQLEAAFSPKTKAVIASHLHGGIVPMQVVTEIARAHKVPVIEDAAQAPGALVEGRRAGTWGDVGVLSFGGSKLLSAGRGGALVTEHADIHQRARVANQRGNVVCPLSELQAAVLLPQLALLDERNRRRAESVRRLGQLPGLTPFENTVNDCLPGYYKVGFRYDTATLGLARERFLAAARAEGIALDEGFRALHVGRSPRRLRAVGELAEATRAHDGVVVLHHPLLLGSDDDVDDVARAVQKIYANRNELG